MITVLEGPCPLNKNGKASQEPGRGRVAALCMVGTLVAALSQSGFAVFFWLLYVQPVEPVA
jgi:hypothetical protein